MFYDTILRNNFWLNVDVKNDQYLDYNKCWNWIGNLDKDGYGRFFYGKEYKAHRLAYEMYYNVDLTLCVICHHCDTPPCVNPTHMFMGTIQDNIDDKVKKNRQFKLITEKQITEIFETIIPLSEFSPKQIAKQFNINENTLRNILFERCQSHIVWPILNKYNLTFKHIQSKIHTGNSTLKTDDVILIKKLIHDNRLTLTKISKMFNVHIGTISDIKRGKTWSQVII